MTSTPTTPNVRLTISVTPEVHQTFQRMAKATGLSISRAMGEWLGDTIEAAEFMTSKVEEARSAPALVLREMQAFARGAADECESVIENLRKKGEETRRVAVAKRGRGAVPPPSPPSGNTGGKGTDKTTTKPTTKRAKPGSKS